MRLKIFILLPLSAALFLSSCNPSKETTTTTEKTVLVPGERETVVVPGPVTRETVVVPAAPAERETIIVPVPVPTPAPE